MLKFWEKKFNTLMCFTRFDLDSTDTSKRPLKCHQILIKMLLNSGVREDMTSPFPN